MYLFMYLFHNFQFGEMQPFFNMPHAFKKIGEMQLTYIYTNINFIK